MWVVSLIESSMSRSNGHRGTFDIIAEILDASHGGAKKTCLMYRCNLSFKQMRSYSRFLIDTGLLRLNANAGNGDTDFFEVTDKGKVFLKAYESLISLLK
jgi:predicted transcriptional regulator